MSNRPIDLEFHDSESEDNQNFLFTKPKSQASIFKKRLKKQSKDEQGLHLQLNLGPEENENNDEVEVQEEPSALETIKILSRKRIRKIGFEKDEWHGKTKSEITKPKSVVEVLRNYGNIEIPNSESKENLYNEGANQLDIDNDNQDSPSENTSQLIFMPDASTVKELKERRYRAQLNELDNQKNNSILEDYDPEDVRTQIIDNNDRENDVDKDENLNDGRLAISKSEQKLQEWMKREEIEEALYNAELSDEDKSDTGDDLANLNLENNVLFPNMEVVYEKVPEFELALKMVNDKLAALQQIRKKKEKKLEQLREETQKLNDKKITYKESIIRLL